jgi:quercetin dioxygenase-like cupin family protein
VKLTSVHEATDGEPLGPEHFMGRAAQKVLHRVRDPQKFAVGLVRFERAARNDWHTHTGGQVLQVVEGRGYAQSRGGPVHPIEVGDIVVIDPGEEHWHGAAEDSVLAHIAITVGEINWVSQRAATTPDRS